MKDVKLNVEFFKTFLVKIIINNKMYFLKDLI